MGSFQFTVKLLLVLEAYFDVQWIEHTVKKNPLLWFVISEVVM